MDLQVLRKRIESGEFLPSHEDDEEEVTKSDSVNHSPVKVEERGPQVQSNQPSSEAQQQGRRDSAFSRLSSGSHPVSDCMLE